MPDHQNPIERHAGRFFHDQSPPVGASFALAAAEASHAAASRRARPGDLVTVFDGSGWDVLCRVESAARGALELSALERVHVGPPLARPVTCAAAMPKGSREDILAAQCAQAGVSRLVPVEFDRSAPNVHRNWPKKAERLRRLAVEAAKQSGASTIMEIADPLTLAEFLAENRRGLRLAGFPGGSQGILETLESAWPFEEVTFLVGPEGGLTDEETRLVAEAGFAAVRLVATILRIETAAAAFAAVCAAFITETAHT